MRRVNYYIKHLLVDESGNFAKAMEWIAEKKDPKIVCHPCISMVTETLCKGLVFKPLLISKVSFIFTVFVFIVASRS